MDACGPLDGAFRRFLLEHYTGVFTETEGENAEFRASMGLEWVPPDDPIEVVEESSDCERVVAEAFRILNDRILSEPPPVTRDVMEWAVLRIGPYWVVPMDFRGVEGITVRQYGDILVFKAEDLSFVTWFLG